MKNFIEYLAPDMAVVEVVVEAGFANSIEDPVENPEIGW